MDPFSSAHRTYIDSGQRIGVIDGKAYPVSNIFISRSKPKPLALSQDWNVYGRPARSKSRPNTSWLNKRDLKRKKRLFKYKWYAMEGKVKSSFKRGLRWFKRTSNRIVHGF